MQCFDVQCHVKDPEMLSSIVDSVFAELELDKTVEAFKEKLDPPTIPEFNTLDDLFIKASTLISMKVAQALVCDKCKKNVTRP
ncbi:hypothetical protein [Oryzomonas rubra]|uniref:Uncharacterized protein n=1 Tax=Oryzomonas rubra TaxID=2509454 RepID=A0A5A9X922_9BACT|nr:hypothetical protein [Oryzomonas rubra]KAA0888699.1 hypothetical protein ET418_15070 [Oryzomonas rubra]